jgi:Ca2+-binding RTX toxin-like protein
VLIGGPGGDILSGGAGTDTVRETANANFTLTNTSLSCSGSDNLVSIEQAELTGGGSGNVFTVTGWSGRATIDGGAGTDRLVASNDGHFKLSNVRLARTTAGDLIHSAIEEASLTGGAGGNVLDASEFTGNVTLDGAGGNDTIIGGLSNDDLFGGIGTDRLIASGDVDFTLAANSLLGLGADDHGGFEEAQLVAGASDNTIVISNFSGSATLGWTRLPRLTTPTSHSRRNCSLAPPAGCSI